MPKTVRKKPSLEVLQSKLGHRFTDPLLLKEALTHASHRAGGCSNDNERLEFLGDRVLGLCIASTLLTRYPQAREIELARRFNALVRGQTCAAIGHRIGLGAHLILSPGEAQAGGRRKDAILSGAMEALLGAIFLDGGFAAAQSAVARLWHEQLETCLAGPDPKTALQEFAQGQKLGLPRYLEISRTGPANQPHFTIEVRIENHPSALGEGKSIKAAEQAAARALLYREGIWLTPEPANGTLPEPVHGHDNEQEKTSA